jgi:hypothetical protein
MKDAQALAWASRGTGIRGRVSGHETVHALQGSQGRPSGMFHLLPYRPVTGFATSIYRLSALLSHCFTGSAMTVLGVRRGL